MARLAALLAHPTSAASGMSIAASWLHDALSQSGHVITEFAPTIRVARTPLTAPLIDGATQLSLSFRGVLAARKFDGIVMHAPAGASVGRGITIFHLNTLEYATACYGRFHPNGIRLRAVDLWYERIGARGPRINIAVSRHQADWLKRANIRVDEVAYPWPKDAASLTPVSHKLELKSALGLDCHRKVVLVCARWDKRKGFKRIQRLVQGFPKVQFVFLGVQASETPQLLPNCKFLGWIPHSIVHQYYQAADLVLSLPVSEAYGLVVLEAIHCGVPLLCTRSGLAADIAAFSPLWQRMTLLTDTAADAQAMTKILDSEALQKDLVAEGLRFFQQHASERLMRERYCELLAHAIS